MLNSNRKHILFLTALLVLPLFDLWTTYLATGGVLTTSNELNPLVQLFGLTFRSLALNFGIEIVVLILLYYFFVMKVPRRKPEYRLLKTPKRKQLFSKMEIKKAAPIFLYIIIFTHLFAGINNLFIHLYQQNSNFAKPIVDLYIDTVHVSGKVYLLYLFIIIIAVIAYFVVTGRNRSFLKDAHE